MTGTGKARDAVLAELLERVKTQRDRVGVILAVALMDGPALAADVERMVHEAGVSLRTYYAVRAQLKAAGPLQTIRQGGIAARGRWLLRLASPAPVPP